MSKSLVYVNKINEFISLVLESRKIDKDNAVIIMGIDEGQKSIKVMLTIKNKILEEKHDVKRRKYSDGNIVENTSKMSSVKQLLLVALMPETQETFPNLQIILEKLDLTGISFTITADIKLVLNLCGKQPASCSYPCCWCQAKSDFTENAPLNTIGSLKCNLDAFRKSGSIKKLAKNYQNVINDVLLKFPDETLILDILNIPELHIYLGITSKVFGFITLAIGEERANVFLKKLNVTKLDYHGNSSLNGNDCKTLISKIHLLAEDLLETDDMDTRRKILGAIDTLQAFGELAHSCFGVHLCDDFEAKIQVFLSKYKALNLSLTPKVHLLSHIKEFLERKSLLGFHNVGLGFFSEQAFESCHASWKKYWSRWCVGSDHQEYNSRLLKAVVSFNSSHIQ